MKVEITDRGAKGVTHNRKPLYKAGEIVEVSEARAKMLVSFVYAKPVKDEPEKADGPSARDLEVAYRYNALRNAENDAPKRKTRKNS